jgi:hypothetical protein
MISIFLILIQLAVAEGPNQSTAGNVEDLPKGTWSVRYGGFTPSLNMTIERAAKQYDFPKVVYNPHADNLSSLGVSYGPFGGSISWLNPTKPGTDFYYGDSTVSDYQFRFFGKKYTFDFFYQYYSGYFIENSEEVDSGITAGMPRIQRPDIKNIHVGAQDF